MKTTENTIPLLVTHPGEIILDEIENKAISQSDFAKQIGYSKSQLNEIIKGKRNLNAELALLLEKALGIDADYWLEVQKNYDLDKAKINQKNQKRLEAIEQWKFIEDRIAVSFLKKEKVITGDPVVDIPTVKNIYNVASFEELANIGAKPTYARFRKSSILKIDPINIITWVKLVHFKASQIVVSQFDYENKNELIYNLRNILNKNLNTLSLVKQTLSDYGIKLVYQKKGEKTPVDAISFWSNGSPSIGMTLRHNRLDNFAFTLFHELGHIYEHLLNNNNAEFIDLESSKEQVNYKSSKEEKEADSFAKNHLIDKEKWDNFFLQNQDYTDQIIKKFAKQIGIHSCIIRGRVCFELGVYNSKTSIDYSLR